MEQELHATLARFMGFAKDSDATPLAVEKLILGVAAFTRELAIPLLRDLSGVCEADFARIVELAVQNGSTPSNVRAINEDDYRHILQNAYEAV